MNKKKDEEKMMKNAIVLLAAFGLSFGACAEWTGAEFVAVQVPVNEHAGDGTAAGLIKSAWRYEEDVWVWEFTIPSGATADVTPPGESAARRYGAGTYVIRQ